MGPAPLPPSLHPKQTQACPGEDTSPLCFRLLPFKVAVLSPGGRKGEEPELGLCVGVGGKRPPSRRRSTPHPGGGERAPGGGHEWMDCYRTPRRLPAPTGRGQGRLRPAFLLPESRPVLQTSVPGLNPCWSDAGEGLTHFYITPTAWGQPCACLAQKDLRHGPRTPVTGQIFVSS